MSVSKKNFVKFLITNLTYKVVFWYRLRCYLNGDYGRVRIPAIIRKPSYYFVFIIQKHYQEKSGIQLRIGTKIGS